MSAWRCGFGTWLIWLVQWGACSPYAGLQRGETDAPIKHEIEKGADSKPMKSGSVVPLETIDARIVGRALELGAEKKAQQMSARLGDDAPSLLLKGRLLAKRGDFEGAIRAYHQMTDKVDEFEVIRIETLSDVLADAGRPEEAVSQIDILLKDERTTNAKRFLLMKKQGEYWQQAGKKDEAIFVLAKALEIADQAEKRDKLRLSLAKLYVETERLREAAAFAIPVALKGKSGTLMRRGFGFLKKHRLMPKWTPEQQLNRAHRLIQFREFKAALKALNLAETQANAQEIAWLKAKILFKKRGHYKQARAAFLAIAKGGGKYADEARFLAARSLSRMDHDAEAIKEYRAFATSTPRRGRGYYARFLSGRLEFYLGRHKEALRSFEWLVGKGRQAKRIRLGDAGDRRDAHFMAGVCAVLLKKPKQAIPHFIAASDGSRHPEVLKRNAYWKVVAETMSGAGKEQGFYEICKADPTDWYARMSANRLVALKKPLGSCEVKPLPGVVSEEADGGVAQDKLNTLPDIDAINEISPLAGLFASAGLYRESAAFLRRAEKAAGTDVSDAVWIRHYISLDSPQYAIRRAARTLDWPPTPDTIDLARAAYPTPYESVAREVERKRDLPEDLLFAIARKESLFDPKAVSWVGAMGMMQMMPKTYEANRKKVGLPRLAPGALPGPIPSLQAAGAEFETLFEQFGGSLPLAIMAYNGGSAAVSRWVNRSGGLPLDVFVEKVGFTQTRNYVRRVTQNLVRYRLLLGKPIPALPNVIKKR